MNSIIIVLMLLFMFLFVISCFRFYYFSKNSKMYEQIKTLNKKSIFTPVVEKISIVKSFNSKKSLYNADGFDVLVFFIKEKEDYYTDLVYKYNYETRLYFEYLEKYNKIINDKYDYDSQIQKKLLFVNDSEFNRYEKNICKFLKKKNKNKINVHLKMYYESPQGRNYYSGETDITYETILEALDTVKRHNEYLKSAKYQRTIMSSSLRYRVLKRDNFKCQYCGASAKEDGVKLEVDHIIPVSKGGKTIISNLQTLCERCNRGKSNK